MTAFDKAWSVVKGLYEEHDGATPEEVDIQLRQGDVDFNSCVICRDKEATTGYNERIACEDCARPRRTGAHGRNEPAMIDCGSCGAESKAIMDLMRCNDCGEHMCDECPGDEALCVGCHPE